MIDLQDLKENLDDALEIGEKAAIGAIIFGFSILILGLILFLAVYGAIEGVDFIAHLIQEKTVGMEK